MNLICYECTNHQLQLTKEGIYLESLSFLKTPIPGVDTVEFNEMIGSAFIFLEWC